MFVVRNIITKKVEFGFKTKLDAARYILEQFCPYCFNEYKQDHGYNEVEVILKTACGKEFDIFEEKEYQTLFKKELKNVV